MTKFIRPLLSSYRNNRKARTGLMLFASMLWLSFLYSADSFPEPYIFCALAGVIACAENTRQKVELSKREMKYGMVFAAFFSLAVFFANYKLHFPLKDHLLQVGVTLPVGFMIGWHILVMAVRMVSRRPPSTVQSERTHVRRWFWFPFLGISAVYLLVLFCCFRPGLLSYDSIQQVNQIRTGVYSNHHPFWHTMIIRVCMGIGERIFHDTNAAVTIYSVFQILCMAAVFAFICMTMYQTGIRTGWIILTAAAYAVIPYHFLYSMTMWKDILFGGAVALFVCALYRIIRGTGSRKLNDFLMAIGAMGVCLLRSNGLTAFAVSFAVLAVVLRKSEKKMLLMLLAVMIASFIMKRPVLNAIGVTQPDLVEYVAIPEQQIARLIVEEVPLEDDELDQIGKIMDTEEVRRQFKPYLSDPLKGIIRKTNPEYLEEHKGDYLALWLRLGRRYPGLYVKQWIDQTRGYWNGGYKYWSVQTKIERNDYGIRFTAQNSFISEMVEKWIKKFFNVPVFRIFRSIGFHVWTVALCGLVHLIRKRKEGLICVLPMTIILTLFITTPIFCEFRYAYAIFTVFPLAVLTTFCTHYEE